MQVLLCWLLLWHTYLIVSEWNMYVRKNLAVKIAQIWSRCVDSLDLNFKENNSIHWKPGLPTKAMSNESLNAKSYVKVVPQMRNRWPCYNLYWGWLQRHLVSKNQTNNVNNSAFIWQFNSCKDQKVSLD